MSLLHKCPRTTERVFGRSDGSNHPVKVRQRSLLCIHWNLRCIFLGLDATSMKRVDGGGTVIKGSPINRFGSFGELSFFGLLTEQEYSLQIRHCIGQFKEKGRFLI